MSTRKIAAKIAEYIEYRIDEGDRHAHVDPETVRALKRAPVRRPPVVNGKRKEPARNGQSLEDVTQAISGCRKCPLHEGRTHTVPGQGCPRPDILFVGEGPGEEEDRQGLAFVGKAGQLLTKMIEAMGYRRDEVFIANIVKCRPPGNRAPLPAEMETCMPYLKQQIALLRPKVIVALGGTALKGLIDPSLGITRARGTWRTFEGIDVMPTFHPAYLLRTQAAKKDTWEDLKSVLAHLGRKPPPRTKSAT